jgi:hypothetical protein
MPAPTLATDTPVTYAQEVIDSIPKHQRYTLGELDERDAAIHAEIQTALDTIKGPRVGDFVIFADGVIRRFSHHHKAYKSRKHPEDNSPERMQTSDGGSWHVGRYGADFSGSLHRGIETATLTDTGETRLGSGWFWHHDRMGANLGVPSSFVWRVYTTTETTTR